MLLPPGRVSWIAPENVEAAMPLKIKAAGTAALLPMVAPVDPTPLFNAPAERVFPDKSSVPAVPLPPRINAVPSGIAPGAPINIVPLFETVVVPE